MKGWALINGYYSITVIKLRIYVWIDDLINRQITYTMDSWYIHRSAQWTDDKHNGQIACTTDRWYIQWTRRIHNGYTMYTMDRQSK